MSELSSKTVCVVDHALYLPLAIELSKSFGRVLYHNAAWVEAFPTLNKCIIGDGYENVQVVEDYWLHKAEVDLFVFPDLYHAGEQLELESQGKRVWGSRLGDRMEVFRGKFLKELGARRLDVPVFEAIEGLDKLREHLRAREDVYIKISRFRGSLETTHWRDWDHDEGLLDAWAVKFGPAKNHLTFYVFDAIDTTIEVGADTYCIDGQYPDVMLCGFEYKDKGYFGSVRKRSEMPEQLQKVNEAFSDELASVRYRNFISSEVRIVDGKFYFIDPTRRAPCPASGSQWKLYTNLPEIIWHGANGELVEPDLAAGFSAECVITAKGDKTCWSVVDFPAELQDWVMCGGSCQIDGRICWPPDESHGEEVGWLVHIGDTPTETIEGMLEKAKLLPDGVSANTDSLVDLLKEIKEADKQGVEFTDKKVPEPEFVVQEEHGP